MTRARIMCVHLTYVYYYYTVQCINNYNTCNYYIISSIDVVIINSTCTMSLTMHALLYNINTKLVKAL